MKNYKFEKYAGYVIDFQDDPGYVWDKISDYWPMETPPDLGVRLLNKRACLIEIEGEGRYPINTPENTLASSMYFIATGLKGLSKEASLEVGQGLKEARQAWGVKLPSGFLPFAKRAFLETTEVREEEVYADEEGNLPVTTIEQYQASVDLFQKNANQWEAFDRICISYNLEKAAEAHGLEAPCEWRKSEFAKEALLLRKEVMQPLDDHELHQDYLNKIAFLLDELDACDIDEIGALACIVEELTELDKTAGMDAGWNNYLPDPFASIVGGVNRGLPKKASTNWDDFNWDGLKNVFDEDIINQIKADPESVVPTLPAPQRQILKDYERR